MFSLHPGPEVSVASMASLAALPATHLLPILAELTRPHVITEQVPGRYIRHDLLRAYAAEQARQEDTEDERHTAMLVSGDTDFGALVAAWRHTGSPAPSWWCLFTLRGRLCPMLGITSSSASGSAAMVAWSPGSWISGSASPRTTRAGALHDQAGALT